MSNFEETFFQLLQVEALLFSEDKRSNKLETVQYFKKTVFYNLVLEFQAKPKTHEAYWISKKMSKSLDPNMHPAYPLLTDLGGRGGGGGSRGI
jgi:hypothetical protein